MKVFELIERLMDIPAGYDVCCEKIISTEDINDLSEGCEDVCIAGSIDDINIDRTNKEITFFIGD